MDSLKRAGADLIKVYQFLPRDVYLAIADEAHSVILNGRYLDRRALDEILAAAERAATR